MPLNVPGILVPFQLLLHPRLVIPNFVVKGIYFYKFIRSFLTVSTQEDIRQIDFAALKQAGYRGAVFDKDNCLVRTTFYSILLLNAFFCRRYRTGIDLSQNCRFATSLNSLQNVNLAHVASIGGVEGMSRDIRRGKCPHCQ